MEDNAYLPHHLTGLHWLRWSCRVLYYLRNKTVQEVVTLTFCHFSLFFVLQTSLYLVPAVNTRALDPRKKTGLVSQGLKYAFKYAWSNGYDITLFICFLSQCTSEWMCALAGDVRICFEKARQLSALNQIVSLSLLSLWLSYEKLMHWSSSSHKLKPQLVLKPVIQGVAGSN